MTLPTASKDEAQSAPMVLFAGATKRFGEGDNAFVALDGVDMAVGRGAITGIIGRSGAGKSTLIRLVNGLEKATSGKVVVDGTEVGGLDETGLRTLRREVGMIFQHFNLLSSRTAFDNIALPLEIAGLDRAAIRAKVGPLLDLVGLGDKAERYPSELSGGQKQRVGIARALATSPKLLLSDEATSALDPETTQSILALLKRINAELGLTVLLITHEMEVVKTIAGELGRSPSQVALAWTLLHPAVTSPLIGARTPAQLADNLGALEIEFGVDQINRLNAVSEIDMGFPHSMLNSGVTDQMFGGVRVDKRTAR